MKKETKKRRVFTWIQTMAKNLRTWRGAVYPQSALRPPCKKMPELLLAACCLLPSAALAQGTLSKVPPAYLDLAQTDVLDVLGLRPTEPVSSRALSFNEVTFVPGPYLGVNPTSGTILGVGTNVLFYLGDPATTLLSTIDNLVAYSTNRQFIFFSKSTVLTQDNGWELLGDGRYYRFSQPLGELGTGPQALTDQGMTRAGDPVRILSGDQQIMFDYLRVHETAFKRLAGNFYAGLGYALDDHMHVADTAFDPAGGEQTITTQAAYSFLHGFDPSRYAVSGISADLLLESRDHVLDAYQGQYLLLAYTFNSTALGSSRESQVFYGEYRKYIPLSKTSPRHVLGFWAMANLVAQGELPYLDLPAEGNDLRERSGRGYAQGSWRGDKLAYAEIEYRFPILNDGLLGGVIFTNAVTTSRPAADNPALGVQAQAVKWFDYLKPAAGAGIRLLVDKEIRMNTELDVARGVDGAGKIYVNIFETF